MKRSIIRIICTLVLMLLTVALARPVNTQNEYNLALSFEKKGELAKAESLYVGLYAASPDNFNYYQHYKNVLIMQRKFGEIIPLIENRLKKRQYDNYLQLELGTVYYADKDKRKARDIWTDVFKDKTGRNKNSYANTIYYEVLEYGLGNEFWQIVKDLRNITSDPRLLVDRNFILSLRYRNWDQAVNEILHILNTNPEDLRYIRSGLFRYDPGSALYSIAADKLSDIDSPEAAELLSDIYIHINENQKAFEVLDKKELAVPFKQFAERMYRQEHYDLAYQAAMSSNKYLGDEREKTATALLAARALEGKFNQITDKAAIIPHPYESAYLKPRFLSFGKEAGNIIQQAYVMYDSLSAGNNAQAELAARFHADITYRVFQDFDGALNEYKRLEGKMNSLTRLHVITRISDLYMARSQYDKAVDYIRSAPSDNRLMVHEEDRLMAQAFYVSVIAGDRDSLIERANDVLAMLPLDDPLYNDILAFTDVVETVADDSISYAPWLEAERAILRNNTATAIDIFDSLLPESTAAKKIIAVRYLDCLGARNDLDAEAIFWENYYKDLLETDMGDYFMLKYAGFLEKNKKFELAYEIFEKYLLSYRESMYYENIREYVRQNYSLGAP